MDIIATYVFWIHHEEEEGVFDFTGQRNLHRFLELCEKWQMHVWLRIGPWAHGEARNGGFPDWLLKKGYKLRSDDPNYLALVERFWKKIYKKWQEHIAFLVFRLKMNMAMWVVYEALPGSNICGH